MTPSAAGAGSSLFQISRSPAGWRVPFGRPLYQHDGGGPQPRALWLTVPVGLLLAPELWWLWSSFGGVAQGGGITLIFIAIIKLARDQSSAGRMSAVVQGAG